MKLKQILIFGIVLILLIAGVVIKNRQKPAELTTEEYVPVSLTLDQTMVSKIEIGKGKDAKPVEMVKSETGEWRIPTFLNARADEKKITDLVKALKEAKGELRSKDKSLYADFGITDDTGYRIAFLDQTGKSLLTVFLGTKTAGYGTAFLRTAGSANVYLTASNLFGQIGIFEEPAKDAPKNEYWADLHLIKAKTDGVDEIMIKRYKGGQETVAAHVLRETSPDDPSKKKWKYVREGVPFALDATKIKQYLDSYQTRPATKVLDPKAKDYGFAAPKWQMKLHQEDGKEVLITMGAEDPETKGFYVQVSTELVVFLFPNYHFTNVDIDDSKFFIDNPLGIDAGQIEKLFVHTPGAEVSVSPKEDKREAVTRYLDQLKGIQAARLMFDASQKINPSSGQLHWIEIKRSGVEGSFFLDVEGRVLEGGREFLAQKRDGTQPFVISESTFKNLFGNVDSLKPAESKPA